MANVLIGIIGVILFIGLALAGALFLGDQFKKTTSQNDAAILIGQIQQMGQALEMYKLKTGNSVVNNQTVDFLVPRFLKKVPVSPTLVARGSTTSYRYKPQLNNDMVTDATAAQAAHLEAVYITTNLGNSQKSRDACEIISKAAGVPLGNVAQYPTNKGGCGIFSGEYVVWQKI